MVRTALSMRSARGVGAVASMAITVLAVAACGSSSSSNSGGGGGSSSLNLTAMDFSFSPNQLSAAGGTSVTVNMTNNGSTVHSFTLDNGSGSVDVDPGSTKSLTFTTPSSGSLQFHCKYHPTQMTGTISIGGSGASSSSGGAGAGY